MSSASSNDRFFGCHPPKPVLTLRVGIIGHRPNRGKYSAGAKNFVGQRLREVFGKVDDHLKGIWKKQQELARKQKNYYDNANPRLRLVTGLAEGADQWAVREIPAGWTVDAVLPFPKPSYLRDFEHSAQDEHVNVAGDFVDCLNAIEELAGTCVEFPEEPPTNAADPASDEYKRRREAGYVRAGRFLLGQVDLLFAVWDGGPPGGPGGTANMVQVALEGEIPVFWVNSLEDVFVRKVEAIADDGRVDAPAADCLRCTLEAAVDSVVLPPVPKDSGAVAFLEGLGGFLREVPPKSLSWWWLTYDIFKRRSEGKWPRLKIAPDTKAEYENRWATLNEEIPEAKRLKQRLDTILLPRYAWADALALEFSHIYRSTYFNYFRLAAVAVLVALSALFVHDVEGDERKLAIKAGLVAVELGAIGVIALFVWFGNRKRWHARWLEYRTLAELLLNVRFLAYLGEHGRAHRIATLESESSAWFLWYLRATIREIGVPDAHFDGAYQWKLLNSVKERVITEQRKWHIANVTSLRRMHDRLFRIGFVCFLATSVVLFAFLAAWAFFAYGMWAHQNANLLEVFGLGSDGPELENLGLCSCASEWMRFGGVLLRLRVWVVLLAALLPAAAAAAASIRETGDFEKVAEQSDGTATDLLDLHRAFERAQNRLKFDHTGEALRRAAQVLTEDLAAWQSVYGHKRLELPA